MSCKEFNRDDDQQNRINIFCRNVEREGKLIKNESVRFLEGVNTNIKTYIYSYECYHIIMVNGVYVDYYID